MSQAIATLHGSGMVALILGKPDAVIERVTEVKKTILCSERGQPIKTYRGLSKTKLAKRYGMKKAADVVTWLESIGKADLLQSGLTAALVSIYHLSVYRNWIAYGLLTKE